MVVGDEAFAEADDMGQDKVEEAAVESAEPEKTEQ